jgi:hypothetical protein
MNSDNGKIASACELNPVLSPRLLFPGFPAGIPHSCYTRIYHRPIFSLPLTICEHVFYNNGVSTQPHCFGAWSSGVCTASKQISFGLSPSKALQNPVGFSRVPKILCISALSLNYSTMAASLTPVFHVVIAKRVSSTSFRSLRG